MEPPARRPRFPRSAAARARLVPAPVAAFLAPAPEVPGAWQLLRRADPPGAPARMFDSLAAAARALALEEEFVLALPLDLGLVARFRLPEAPAEDLRAMVRIQLEKLVSYADEDLGFAHAVIERTENEVTLAAYAVHQERLLALCQPLVELARWPRQVTFSALLKAAAVSGSADADHALLAFRENGRTILGVLERGRLSFAQPLPGAAAPETLADELPSLLLGAELEGVPTTFDRLLLDRDLPAAWREAFTRAGLAAAGDAPAAVVPALPPIGAALEAVDLSPPAWHAGRRRRLRAVHLRRRLRLAGIAYLALVVLGFADLARLRFLQGRYDKQISRAAKPLAEAEAARKRWQALAPAVDFRQSAVEILDQVRQCLPPGDSDLRITLFEQNRLRSPGVLTLEGEAPSANIAVDLGEKLRNRPELREFRLAPESPVILPNGRARLRVSGRLP